MKRTLLAAIAFAGLAGGTASAVNVINGPNWSLDLNGRFQLLGLGEIVRDPYQPDGRVYLFMKQARMEARAESLGIRYHFQAAFAGEDQVVTPNPGVSLNLLDLSADAPLNGPWRVIVGQFRVPYSRERLEDSGTLLFADRSIQNLGFRMGRDVGAALHTGGERWGLAAGMFAGGGRDVPERYLPERLGFPLTVVRAGWNDGVDKDIFTVAQEHFDPDRVRAAAHVNILYMRDTIIGHSTVDNVKLAERSLLLDTNWNPYMARKPFSAGDLWQEGLDGVVEMPAPRGSLSFEGEANHGSYANRYGRLDISGLRVQSAWDAGPYVAAFRYAVLFPSDNFFPSTGTVAGQRITGGSPIHELTPSLTFRFNERRTKVIFDLPILLNVPVTVERGIGAYVLSDLPDQSSVLTSGGSVHRRTVVEGRMLIQFSF
jgi:hypothetical protein